VGGDRAFAKDHPGVGSAAEVDDGGCDVARGGAAVDDEGDFFAELLAHLGRIGAFGLAAKVGRSGGYGQAELGNDCTADGCFRDAQGDVAGVGRDAQGQLAAGLDDDSERAGPEFFGELIELGADGSRELVGLGYVGDEQRERLVTGAGFQLVDVLDGAEIDGVDGEAIEGVGGERNDVAALQRLDDLGYQVGLRFVRMNTKDFSDQTIFPQQ